MAAAGIARCRGCRSPGLWTGASSGRHPPVTRSTPAPRYTGMEAGRSAVDAVIRRLFTWPPGASRARARAAAAATAELDRKQAMFRDELEQRLQVQRQLRESEARVRAIVDSAAIVLFAIDRDGAITFSAGVGPDPLGKKPGEAVGWSAADLFVEHPRVVEGIRQSLSGIEGRAELTQGERTFSFSLAPFRDAAGNTAGAIVVAMDVTEGRRTEAALRQSVETLKQVDQNRRALLRRLVNAQEAERRAIASDIHDDSIQSMFAVGLRLFSLRESMHDAAQIEQVDRLQQNVQQSTDRLRHLLFELRPAALDEGGLPAALRQYLDTMKQETGIEVELQTALEHNPASETQVIAYRIAQEVLANVRKHARARRVECAVSAVDDGVLTRIVDNGVGFDSGRNGSVPGHLGLIAMRERAEMAGGWFRITSSAGQGCVVEYWIPDAREVVSNAA
ncbi:MAG: PAS domain S-box protein [Chloroflexi bacterium]|nr:MAG: PAS domain S-box protein [Chloroflexota bacterium]